MDIQQIQQKILEIRSWFKTAEYEDRLVLESNLGIIEDARNYRQFKASYKFDMFLPGDIVRYLGNISKPCRPTGCCNSHDRSGTLGCVVGQSYTVVQQLIFGGGCPHHHLQLKEFPYERSPFYNTANPEEFELVTPNTNYNRNMILIDIDDQAKSI